MNFRVLLMLAVAGCGVKEAARPPLPTGAVPLSSSLSADSASMGEYTGGKDEAVLVARAGDTLEILAEREINAPGLWRHLMEWNKLGRYGRDGKLPAGEKVYMPERFRVLVPAAGRRQLDLAPRRAFPAINFSFEVGEKLEYAVRYLGITAGHATMHVRPPVIYNDVRCMHFEANARSKILFFFKVNDWVTSIARAHDLLPVRFEKRLREGKYKKDQVIEYDLDSMLVKWEGKTASLEEGCRDIMAAFFHFRSMDLPEPGGEVELCVNTDNTNYPLIVEVVRRETVSVPAGKFASILIKPRMKFEGLFRQRGEMRIWLSDDAAHVPVLVKAKVFLLGSVSIVLLERGKS